LVRNIGSAAGISIMQSRFVSGIEGHHARLVEHARPDNPLYQAYAPQAFQSLSAIAGVNGAINRQAAMLSYIDDFRLMLAVSILCAPLILLMRSPKAAAAGPGKETPIHAAD
jgi:DHA2 family multidrug resistance protein